MKKLILASFILLALSGCTNNSRVCVNLRAIDNSELFHKFNPSVSPEMLKKQVQKLSADGAKLKASAPAALTSDIDTFSKSIAAFDTVLASKDYDATKVASDPEAKAAISKASSDADAATKSIDDYYTKTCK